LFTAPFSPNTGSNLPNSAPFLTLFSQYPAEAGEVASLTFLAGLVDVRSRQDMAVCRKK
jgi:hypothetical protein